MKIVSGGQTGVDQAVLDAARELGLPYGGYVPAGRWTEDGPLSDDYAGMIEIEGGPMTRTKRNVRESDATVIFTCEWCEGGTLLTLQTAESARKPHLILDLGYLIEDQAAAELLAWLRTQRPQVLNIAGPRASKLPWIYKAAKEVLMIALTRFATETGN